MARKPRMLGDNIHYHVIVRCNNREHLLKNSDEFELFLDVLRDTKKERPFRLYNYELLNTHAHLMLSTHEPVYLDEIMHSVCLKFAKTFNEKHGRIGHFWAHRYRSRIIHNDLYGIACLRYQHRNSTSCGIVHRPLEWPWSGYKFYTNQAGNDLLELHPSFLVLCEDPIKRIAAYEKIVMTSLPADKNKTIFEGRGSNDSKRCREILLQLQRLIQQLA